MYLVNEYGVAAVARFPSLLEWTHRRAFSANDANQPVARHFNSGSHCISDMKIRALSPISGSNDSHKRQEMRLISKLGTLHPLGINERFSFI